MFIFVHPFFLRGNKEIRTFCNFVLFGRVQLVGYHRMVEIGRGVGSTQGRERGNPLGLCTGEEEERFCPLLRPDRS